MKQLVASVMSAAANPVADFMAGYVPKKIALQAAEE
jgi:hypothetical protein